MPEIDENRILFLHMDSMIHCASHRLDSMISDKERHELLLSAEDFQLLIKF